MGLELVKLKDEQKPFTYLLGKTGYFLLMGHGNLFLKDVLKENNLLLLGWDINARDVFGVTKMMQQKLFKKLEKKTSPQILLFYDGSYASTRERTGFLELVEAVIGRIF